MSMKTWFSGLFAKRQSAPQQQRPVALFRGRHAGIVITHDKALELAACFACVRAISEDIAKLPFNVYGRRGNKRIRLDRSTISYLLNTRPNPTMGAFTFRETMTQWALTWGNGYAEIERDMANRPIALWPIEPHRVEVDEVDGRLVYKIMNQSGAQSILDQDNVFHLKGMGDGIVGYSLIGLAAESIGFGIAAEQYGSGFFGNNTTPGMAVKVPTKLSEPAYNRLKEELEKRKGSKNAFSGLILEEGLDFARPNMSQTDAQYIESMRLVSEQMCRWFRVPPHKIQDLTRAHFNNVESENTNYAVDTLTPWAIRWEQEADYKLISNRALADYTKMSIQALMRGDSAGRATFYKEMFNMGAFSPNMILELEDMDPIGDEGDEHYIQSNMTTLKKIVTQPVDPASPPTQSGAPSENTNEGQ